MNDKTAKLVEVLMPSNENIYTLCAAVVDFIDMQMEKEQEEYFKALLSELELTAFDTSEVGDDSFTTISDPSPECAEAIESMARLAPQLVKNLVMSKVTQEHFYKELWQQYGSPTLVPNRESKIAFIMALWLHKQIPYFQFEDGIRMEDEEYKKQVEMLKPYLDQAFYILNSKFEQRTERASLLLRLANQLDGETAQTVFWSTIIGFYELQIVQVVRANREQEE